MRAVKKNPLTRMAIRGGGQLAFRQFKDRHSSIMKPKTSPDFLEDANPIINDHNRAIPGTNGKVNLRFGSTRVINRIIKHFRKAVMTNSLNVLPKVLK